jgi:Flp pilus assembly protein TadG
MKRTFKKRRGKILVMLAILLPALCGVAGLTIDMGLLTSTSEQIQHAADAAATAAAFELRRGRNLAAATSTAIDCVHSDNNLPGAAVQVHCPPISGAHAGSPNYVQVSVQTTIQSIFMHVLSGSQSRTVTARAVAGYEPSTANSAVMVLDPDPPPFQLGLITPLLPPLPAILGGMEVLGVGHVEIDGAVIVNNTWGGRDERNRPAGRWHGPPHAISATPLLGLSKLKARDIYVVGGVDAPWNYGPFRHGDPQPLKCNRLPVADPFRTLPPPTVASDPRNVNPTYRGHKTVIGLPLIGPPVVLEPGVYDWIEVISGIAIFKPGVYIIRGRNPLTQLSLSMLAGQVHADGVMFYITNSHGYSAASGLPDANDGEIEPPGVNVATLLPAAVINIGLLGSTYRPLSDTSSPFHNMLIYQRRHDRRQIVLLQEDLLGNGTLRGTIYSKWGHLVFAGKGTYDARFVVGTVRFVALLNMTINPTATLPAAQDVYLVE